MTFTRMTQKSLNPPIETTTNTESASFDVQNTLQQVLTATNANGDALSLKQRVKYLYKVHAHLNEILQSHSPQAMILEYARMELFFTSFLDILAAPLTKSMQYQGQHLEMKEIVLQILQTSAAFSPRKSTEFMKQVAIGRELHVVDWSLGMLTLVKNRIPMVALDINTDNVNKVSKAVKYKNDAVENSKAVNNELVKNSWTFHERTIEFLEYELCVTRILELYRTFANATQDLNLMEKILQSLLSLFADASQPIHLLRRRFQPHFTEMADLCIGHALQVNASASLRRVIYAILQNWAPFWLEQVAFSRQLLDSLASDIIRAVDLANLNVEPLFLVHFLIAIHSNSTSSMKSVLDAILKLPDPICTHFDNVVLISSNLSSLHTIPGTCQHLISALLLKHFQNSALLQCASIQNLQSVLQTARSLLQHPHVNPDLENTVPMQILRSGIFERVLVLGIPNAAVILTQIALSYSKSIGYPYIKELANLALNPQKQYFNQIFHIQVFSLALADSSNGLQSNNLLQFLLDHIQNHLSLHSKRHIISIIHAYSAWKNRLKPHKSLLNTALELISTLSQGYLSLCLKIVDKLTHLALEPEAIAPKWAHNLIQSLQSHELCMETEKTRVLLLFSRLSIAYNQDKALANAIYELLIKAYPNEPSSIPIFARYFAIGVLFEAPKPSIQALSNDLFTAHDLNTILIQLSCNHSLEPHLKSFSHRAKRFSSDTHYIRHAADFCVRQRLCSRFGGPAQTFAALEEMLTQRSEALMEFIGFLELSIAHYTAFRGFHDPESMRLRQFYRANQRVCQDWLYRLRCKFVPTDTSAYVRYSAVQSLSERLQKKQMERVALDKAFYRAFEALTDVIQVRGLARLVKKEMHELIWLEALVLRREWRYEQAKARYEEFFAIFDGEMEWERVRKRLSLSETSFFGCIRDYISVLSALSLESEQNAFLARVARAFPMRDSFIDANTHAQCLVNLTQWTDKNCQYHALMSASLNAEIPAISSQFQMLLHSDRRIFNVQNADATLFALPLQKMLTQQDLSQESLENTENYALCMAKFARKQGNPSFSNNILNKLQSLTIGNINLNERIQFSRSNSSEALVSLCTEILSHSPTNANLCAKVLVKLSQFPRCIPDSEPFLARESLTMDALSNRTFQCLTLATKLAPEKPDVWLAYSEFCYHTAKTLDLEPHFSFAIYGYAEYLARKSCPSPRVCLRLIHLSTNPAHASDCQQVFAHCPLLPWLILASQLFARLQTSSLAISTLLTRLATHFPAQIVYLAVVQAETEESQAILKAMDPVFVQNVLAFTQELERIAQLHDERWISALEKVASDISRRASTLEHENSRVGKNETLSEAEKSTLSKRKFVALLRPIFAALEDVLEHTKAQTTPYEIAFHARYGQELTAAVQRFREALHGEQEQDVQNIYAPFAQLESAFKKDAVRREQMDLADVSPRILALLQSQTGVSMPASVDRERIVQMRPFLRILKTKTKPKHLEVVSERGTHVGFLLKAREDLRLDERIMQFLKVMNYFLTPETMATHYAVLPLSPRAGLIQMVPNVVSLFQIYAQHAKNGENPSPTAHFHAKLGNSERSHAILKRMYEELAMERSRNLVRMEIFSKHDDWHGVRIAMDNVTRSMAVTSALGYVIGLGDRHLDNILLCPRSGNLIHIDYNVCFDRGRQLKVPETVPFRLTPMMQDALSFQSVYGEFAHVFETVLQTVRSPEAKDSIRTLMEAFVFDPLTEWTARDDKNERNRMELDVNFSLFSSRAEERKKEIEIFDQSVREAFHGAQNAIHRLLCDGKDLMDAFQALNSCQKTMRQKERAIAIAEREYAAQKRENEKFLNVYKDRLNQFVLECHARHLQMEVWRMMCLELNDTELPRLCAEFRERNRWNEKALKWCLGLLQMHTDCASYLSAYVEQARANAAALGEESACDGVYLEWYTRLNAVLKELDSEGARHWLALWRSARAEAEECIFSGRTRAFALFSVEMERLNELKALESMELKGNEEVEATFDAFLNVYERMKLSNAQHSRLNRLIRAVWTRNSEDCDRNAEMNAAYQCAMAMETLTLASKSTLRKMNASQVFEAHETNGNEALQVVHAWQVFREQLLQRAFLAETAPSETRSAMEQLGWDLKKLYARVEMESVAITDELGALYESVQDMSHARRPDRSILATISDKLERFFTERVRIPLERVRSLEEEGSKDELWYSNVELQLQEILPSSSASSSGMQWFRELESSISALKHALYRAHIAQYKDLESRIWDRAIQQALAETQERCRCLEYMIDGHEPSSDITRPQLLSVLKSHQAQMQQLAEEARVIEKLSEMSPELLQETQTFAKVFCGILIFETSRREPQKEMDVDRVGKELLNDIIRSLEEEIANEENVMAMETLNAEYRMKKDVLDLSLAAVQAQHADYVQRIRSILESDGEELQTLCDSLAKHVASCLKLLPALEKPESKLETQSFSFLENQRLGRILAKSVKAVKEFDRLEELLHAHDLACTTLCDTSIARLKGPMLALASHDTEELPKEFEHHALAQRLYALSYALSNYTPLQIIEWLKECDAQVGACVELFFEITKLANQSSLSIDSEPATEHEKLKESTNRYALQVVERIDAKLSGIKVDGVMNDERTEVMSVHAQAEWLIQEATSVDNLCEMYEGWTPWI